MLLDKKKILLNTFTSLIEKLKNDELSPQDIDNLWDYFFNSSSPKDKLLLKYLFIGWFISTVGQEAVTT